MDLAEPYDLQVPCTVPPFGPLLSCPSLSSPHSACRLLNGIWDAAGAQTMADTEWRRWEEVGKWDWDPQKRRVRTPTLISGWPISCPARFPCSIHPVPCGPQDWAEGLFRRQHKRLLKQAAFRSRLEETMQQQVPLRRPPPLPRPPLSFPSPPSQGLWPSRHRCLSSRERITVWYAAPSEAKGPPRLEADASSPWGVLFGLKSQNGFDVSGRVVKGIFWKQSVRRKGKEKGMDGKRGH